MAFFDFHCHPFTKAVWMQGDRQELLAENIVTVIDRQFKPGIGNLILRLFGGSHIKFFDSQSSLKQINQGSGHIICASLVAMENSYANLDFCAFKNVFQRIQNVNREQLAKLGKSEMSYSDVMGLERSLVTDFAGKDLSGTTYRIVNSFEEIKSDGVINVILSIEGGHCFYELNSVLEQESNSNASKVIEVLKDWKRRSTDKQLPLEEQLPRLFYITLTHHTTNCLTNHAFGVPPALAGTGKNKVAGGFNPGGNSLTEVGKNFIKTALDINLGSRILIDIKHLSLRARLDFYELRRQMIRDGHPTFPIIATHMGVTGLSLEDAIVVPQVGIRKFADDDNCFEVEYMSAQRLQGFFIETDLDSGIDILQFNPWTINLFDEDIKEIVDSDGLIGFSFDSRILGNEGVDRERFSRREISPIPSVQSINFKKQTKLDNGEVVFLFQNKKEFSESRYPEKPIIHLPFSTREEVKRETDLLSLCQNIIHAIRVGGAKTWDCICIGSDYDGLINSIDSVPNSAAIPSMENKFRQYLTLMVEALNDFIEEQPEHDQKESKIEVPSDYYERFVIENAKRFLQKNF